MMLGLLVIAVLAAILPIVALARANRAVELAEDLRREITGLAARLNRLALEREQRREPAGTPERAAGVPAPAVSPLTPAHPPLVHDTPPDALDLPRSRPAGAVPMVVVASSDPAAADTLEARIGSRWLLYVGTVALVLGVGFFVKHAFDNEWVTPAARVLIGGGAGLVLIAAGLAFERRGYRLYGQIIAGGGVASLYVSTYAAFTVYELVGRVSAFTLMILITSLAAALADRQRSEGLAVMAVGGGFLTPFLVGGAVDSPVPLFTYDAILVGGTAYLSQRRRWLSLNLLAFGSTLLSLAAWMASSYRAPHYLTVELFFTLFAILFVRIMREGPRGDDQLEPVARGALMATPLIYHVASLGVLFAHPAALLLYLIAACAVGVIVAVQRGSVLLRLLVWLAVSLPLFGWAGSDPAQGWIPGTLAALIAVYAMHLLPHVMALRSPGALLVDLDVLLLHLNGLGLFAGAYLLLDPWRAAAMGALAGGLAAWNAAAAVASRKTSADASVHQLALAFTLAATAIGLQFDGRWVTIGWAAEGAAIMWIGLSVGREWFRLAGALLLVVAGVRFLGLELPVVPIPFVPFANARIAVGAFLVALCYLLAWRHARNGQRLAEGGRFDVAVLVSTANVLTGIMLTAEILDLWPFDTTPRAFLTRQVLVSIAWGVYAVVAVAVGIRRRYAPIRYLAIALFALAAGKVFLVDLSALGGIYRVWGFVATGLVLLVGSWLYQRFKAKLA